MPNGIEVGCLSRDADYAATQIILDLPFLAALKISDWKSFDDSFQLLFSQARAALTSLHVDKGGKNPCWSSSYNQVYDLPLDMLSLTQWHLASKKCHQSSSIFCPYGSSTTATMYKLACTPSPACGKLGLCLFLESQLNVTASRGTHPPC